MFISSKKLLIILSDHINNILNSYYFNKKGFIQNKFYININIIKPYINNVDFINKVMEYGVNIPVFIKKYIKDIKSIKFCGFVNIEIIVNFNIDNCKIQINFLNTINNIQFIKKEERMFFRSYSLPIIKSIKNKTIYDTINDVVKNKVKFEENFRDFLVLSFNESNKKYNLSDCLPIIYRVIKECPKFIVVNTQESHSGNVRDIFSATHFQHILKNALLLLDYDMLIKTDASIRGIKDMNIRSRIYYNKKYINFKKSNNDNHNKKFDENETIFGDNINNENYYQIISTGSKKSKESGLGLKKENTYFKG